MILRSPGPMLTTTVYIGHHHNTIITITKGQICRMKENQHLPNLMWKQDSMLGTSWHTAICMLWIPLVHSIAIICGAANHHSTDSPIELYAGSWLCQVNTEPCLVLHTCTHSLPNTSARPNTAACVMLLPNTAASLVKRHEQFAVFGRLCGYLPIPATRPSSCCHCGSPIEGLLEALRVCWRRWGTAGGHALCELSLITRFLQ